MKIIIMIMIPMIVITRIMPLVAAVSWWLLNSLLLDHFGFNLLDLNIDVEQGNLGHRPDIFI